MPLTAKASDPYIRRSTDQRDSHKHMKIPTPTFSQPTFGPWAIGIIAGLVSAVLFASASTGTLLGTFVLFFLSPLPVGIAGLGWGWQTSGIASAVAAVALGLGIGPRAGVVHAIAIGLPTIVSAYYLLLNRVSGGTDAVNGAPLVEWYPLGRIVAGIALFAGVLSAISLLSLGTDIDSLKAAFRPVVERTFVTGIPKGSSAPGPLTPARIA